MYIYINYVYPYEIYNIYHVYPCDSDVQINICEVFVSIINTCISTHMNMVM